MESEFFIRISGENEELAEGEVQAVLETEEIGYIILKRLPQVILLSSNPQCVEAITRKCAMTREGGSLLFICKAEMGEIIHAVSGIRPNRLGEMEDRFSVRIRRIQGSSREIHAESLEGEMGRMILERRPDLKVDLRNPRQAFLGLLTGGNMVFGLKRIEVRPRDYQSRRPRDRPFFHPSSMAPMLARTMANLSRCREGELLLDPFCGTGGILLEAGLTGRRVLGSDVKPEMVEGTLRNLSHAGVDYEGLVASEIGNLPFIRVDSIATDTPYGKLSTTLGNPPEYLIEKLLNSASKVIPDGRFICIGSRIETWLMEKAETAGFTFIKSFHFREHRSLTRVILVLRKEG